MSFLESLKFFIFPDYSNIIELVFLAVGGVKDSIFNIFYVDKYYL